MTYDGEIYIYIMYHTLLHCHSCARSSSDISVQDDSQTAEADHVTVTTDELQAFSHILPNWEYHMISFSHILPNWDIMEHSLSNSSVILSRRGTWNWEISALQPCFFPSPEHIQQPRLKA